MTHLEQRTSAFVQLGKTLNILSNNTIWPGFEAGITQDEFDLFQEVIDRHLHLNGWFTRAEICRALQAWSEALTQQNLQQWLAGYDTALFDKSAKTIGIICAGNIPMVGFHDVLCVLISGHKAKIKLSSSDNQLIPQVLQLLARIDPQFAQSFEFVEKLKDYDAIIATGSNNTSRYFEHYFADVPHIIRKSRSSLAILDGHESAEELMRLGHDIFDYYGLGCRNVSKIYLPKGYNINTFIEAIYPYNEVIYHNKYANNYDYNKAVWLLNTEALLDNGFILLKEDSRLTSPTASLFYEYYDNPVELMQSLKPQEESIQCIVGHSHLPFGSSQKPNLWDYADNVDTMKFLAGIDNA